MEIDGRWRGARVCGMNGPGFDWRTFGGYQMISTARAFAKRKLRQITLSDETSGLSSGACNIMNGASQADGTLLGRQVSAPV